VLTWPNALARSLPQISEKRETYLVRSCPVGLASIEHRAAMEISGLRNEATTRTTRSTLSEFVLLICTLEEFLVA
jgi:hypothetical protein